MKIAQVAAAFLAVLSLAIALVAQTATSAVSTSQTILVNATLPDPCTLENVAMTGTIQVNTSVWPDGSGATHIRIGENFAVTGVGQTSSLTYTVNGGSSQVEHITTDLAPQEITQLTRMSVNGSGPLPNESMRILFHTTVDANGNATSEISSNTLHCSGK